MIFNKVAGFALIFISTLIPSLKSQSINPSDKPVLVIQIVIEQMRYDLIARYWDSFSDKGFKRLVNEGFYFKNATYDYIVTESAPGYATLATGNNPSGHGIISDSWYLRLSDREQYCVEDKKLEDKPGLMPGNKYSPRQLIGSTLGDELRMSNFKQSKVIGISGNAYAAILTTGYLGNAAYWIDSTSGNWTSSGFYMDSVPRWARQFNEKEFLQLYLSREWNIIKPKNTYNQSLSDNNSYEKGFGNNQRTFPYKLAELKRSEGMSLINYTPFGNNYIMDFGVNAILNENLGKDNYTDLLTISFPTTGNITDLFGLRSVELQDIYIRLDYDIAHLLQFIDDSFGKDKVIVILTSDKGASDNFEFMKDVGIPVGKFYPAQSVSLLESYLKALYGKTGWVKHYSDKQIYLNDITIDASRTPPGEVQMKAALFMSQFQAVANTTTAHVLQTTEFTEGDLNKFQNNFNLTRSGDVLISLKPGYVEEDIRHLDKIKGSNSPYRYDSHVPLIFYGWKIKHKESGIPVSMTDVAATLARILDISLPSGTQGKAIEELFKE